MILFAVLPATAGGVSAEGYGYVWDDEDRAEHIAKKFAKAKLGGAADWVAVPLLVMPKGKGD